MNLILNEEKEKMFEKTKKELRKKLKEKGMKTRISKTLDWLQINTDYQSFKLETLIFPGMIVIRDLTEKYTYYTNERVSKMSIIEIVKEFYENIAEIFGIKIILIHEWVCWETDWKEKIKKEYASLKNIENIKEDMKLYISKEVNAEKYYALKWDKNEFDYMVEISKTIVKKFEPLKKEYPTTMFSPQYVHQFEEIDYYFEGIKDKIKIGFEDGLFTFNQKKFHSINELEILFNNCFEENLKKTRVKNVYNPPKKYFSDAIVSIGFYGYWGVEIEKIFKMLMKKYEPTEIELKSKNFIEGKKENRGFFAKVELHNIYFLKIIDQYFVVKRGTVLHFKEDEYEIAQEQYKKIAHEEFDKSIVSKITAFEQKLKKRIV